MMSAPNRCRSLRASFSCSSSRHDAFQVPNKGANRPSRRVALQDISLDPSHTELAVGRAAPLLAERGDVRGMVMLAYMSDPSAATVTSCTESIAGEARAWLEQAAGRGDVWALLVMAALRWELCSYTAAAELVGTAAELVQQRWEKLEKARPRALPAQHPGPAWRLQCVGSECRLAAVGRGGASTQEGAQQRASPARQRQQQQQPLQPQEQPVMTPASVLGSYDALAGGAAAWEDLQQVCRVVGEVVAAGEGGLEVWALLELLHEEEQRQRAARQLRLAP